MASKCYIRLRGSTAPQALFALHNTIIDDPNTGVELLLQETQEELHGERQHLFIQTDLAPDVLNSLLKRAVSAVTADWPMRAGARPLTFTSCIIKK